MSIKSPILFSGTRGIFLVAQPNGEIHFWNSLSHMLQRQQAYALLEGHSSGVGELVLTDRGFVSAGAEDGQVIVWENVDVEVEPVSDDEDEGIGASGVKAKGTEGQFGANRGREDTTFKAGCQMYMD